MGFNRVARVLVVCLLVAFCAGALAAPAHAETTNAPPGDRPPGDGYQDAPAAAVTDAEGKSGTFTSAIAEALTWAGLEPIEILPDAQLTKAKGFLGLAARREAVSRKARLAWTGKT
jgi:hypothetical protein